jgi:molybdopterin adenylyltransferase
MIRAAVLTISDSVHAGVRQDVSGPAVAQRLEQLGWTVAAREAIPDDAESISRRLATLADGNDVSAIFTTGGTGIAPRDVTPEATRAVIDREIPGLAESMRIEGRAATPMAALSRAVAGARGKVLIVNLPGSPRGAVESLNAIVGVVPHALDLLRGNTEHAPQTKPGGGA